MRGNLDDSLSLSDHSFWNSPRLEELRERQNVYNSDVETFLEELKEGV
jgi:hypothetical protein